MQVNLAISPGHGRLTTDQPALPVNPTRRTSNRVTDLAANVLGHRCDLAGSPRPFALQAEALSTKPSWGTRDKVVYTSTCFQSIPSIRLPHREGKETKPSIHLHVFKAFLASVYLIVGEKRENRLYIYMFSKHSQHQSTSSWGKREKTVYTSTCFQSIPSISLPHRGGKETKPSIHVRVFKAFLASIINRLTQKNS